MGGPRDQDEYLDNHELFRAIVRRTDGLSHTGSKYDRKAANKFIRKAARALSDSCGLDVQRVREILERTACPDNEEGLAVDWSRVSDKPSDDVLRSCFYPSLRRALDFLPPEDALGLFEPEKLQKVQLHDAILFYLQMPDTPLHNWAELAGLTRAFIKHLAYNKDHILKTGHQQTSFERSSWLSTELLKLYCTKFPSNMKATRDSEENCIWWYSWQRAGKGSHKKKYVNCSFENADILPVLSAEDAQRLDSSREKLFELKMRLLRELVRSTASGDATGLWERCLRHIVKAISSDEEADFLLGIDSLYAGCDLRNGRSAGQSHLAASAGGLTSILTTIGHYEKELTIGTLAHTRDRLGEEIIGRLRGPDVELLDYFEAAKLMGRQALDDTLDRFLAMEAQENEFWPEYRKRVNEALESELEVEVSATVSTKRKFAHKFGPQVRRFVDYLIGCLQLTGEVPEITLGALAIGPQDDSDLLVTRVAPAAAEEFRASEHYRTVWWHGQQLEPLTPNQAEVVCILDEARKAGQPIMSHASILSKMDNPPARLSDTFRRSDPRRVLIKRVGKDTYRLNV